MVDEFPVTLSCLKDQTWSEGTKMMKLMRSSEVSNLFCNLTKSSISYFLHRNFDWKSFFVMEKKSTIQLFKSKYQYIEHNFFK